MLLYPIAAISFSHRNYLHGGGENSMRSSLSWYESQVTLGLFRVLSSSGVCCHCKKESWYCDIEWWIFVFIYCAGSDKQETGLTNVLPMLRFICMLGDAFPSAFQLLMLLTFFSPRPCSTFWLFSVSTTTTWKSLANSPTSLGYWWVGEAAGSRMHRDNSQKLLHFQVI